MKSKLYYIAFLITLVIGFMYGIIGISQDDSIRAMIGGAILLLSGFLSYKAEQHHRRDVQAQWDRSIK